MLITDYAFSFFGVLVGEVGGPDCRRGGGSGGASEDGNKTIPAPA